jgi:hypothetical protein
MDASLSLQSLERRSFEISGGGRVSQYISIPPAARFLGDAAGANVAPIDLQGPFGREL